MITLPSILFPIMAMIAMIPQIHATFLTNAEIKAKATELLRFPEKIMELYAEHKNARGSGTPSSLERLLTSIHVDSLAAHPSSRSSRHVIQILTDDQGWADIGYNDPTFVTPTIDFFAGQGIKLTNFYTHCTCTPSRASLITGKYAIKTGLQDGPVIPGERRNLPVGMPTMPEFFKQAGYSTMLIGKWHLGQEFLNMTPRHRGYDYFFGILGGALDHFSKDIGVGCGTEENDFHEVFADNCRFFNAYDLQENGVPYFDQSTFIIDLLAQKAVEQISAHDTTKSLLLSFHPNVPHAPVKAPQPYVDLCEGSSQSSRALRPHFRQKICGMVASVDVATLQIVLALHLKDMLSSSLIFYISDNGGFLEAGSSNLPYREGKGSVYEGGIHVPAFLYGHGIQGSFRSKSNLTDLFHVSDVLPTLLGYADIPTKNYKFDGYNHWNNLVLGKPLKRTRVPVNAASLAVGLYSAMIQKAFGKTWKYLFNPSVLIYAGLHPPSHGAAKYKIEGEFLFDLTSDPLETKNLIPYIDHFAHTDLEVVEVLNLLRFELLAFRSTGVASQLKKLPIDVVIHPSPGGCWLPLDSPHFLNSTCPVPPPVTPDNVFETYNLTSIARQLDTTEEKDKDLQEMVDADGTTFAL